MFKVDLYQTLIRACQSANRLLSSLVFLLMKREKGFYPAGRGREWSEIKNEAKKKEGKARSQKWSQECLLSRIAIRHLSNLSCIIKQLSTILRFWWLWKKRQRSKDLPFSRDSSTRVKSPLKARLHSKNFFLFRNLEPQVSKSQWLRIQRPIFLQLDLRMSFRNFYSNGWRRR